MKTLLIRHRHTFTALAFLCVIGIATFGLAGCGVPAWLSDASSIIGLVGSSITAVGAFIAGLTGNAALAAALAVVADWITKIETGISDLEELVSQYDVAPTPGLLADIEAGLADVRGNLQQDFSNLGLPSSVLAVVAGAAGLALSQLEAWGSLIPAAKAQAMTTFTVKTPYTKAQYKQQFNALLATTGDAQIDAALAQVKRL